MSYEQELMRELARLKSDIERMKTFETPRPSYARRNYIINGDFSVWQGGTTFGSNPGFLNRTADFWTAAWNGSSGGNTIVARYSQAPGAGGDPNYVTSANGYPYWGYDTPYHMQITRAAVPVGASYLLLVQYLEDLRQFAGKTFTLSFWAFCDSAVNNNLSVIVANNYGTGGSAQSVPLAGGTSIAIPGVVTGAWKRYIVTLSILNQLSGKTIGAGNNLELQIRMNVNYTGSWYFQGVQFEEGLLATPFIKPSQNHNLLDCFRYYQKSWQLDTLPGTVTNVGRVLAGISQPSSGLHYMTQQLRAPMRIPYTAQVYNPVTGTAGQVYNYTRNNSSTAVTMTGNGSESTFEFNITPPAGWAAGDLIGYHWTAIS